MSVNRCFPQGVPKAIGPYSPVTSIALNKISNQKQKESSDQLIFISGQIPINPETNTIQSKDIVDQTHQTMKNLCRALQGSNSSLSSILKTTILLTVFFSLTKDMQNFSKVNEVYGSYFANEEFPARICFAVKQLPKESLIQIEAIAIRQTKIEGEASHKKHKKQNEEK